MPGRTGKTTTDHEEIRRWAEERGGHPATVRRTRGERGKDDPGIIRIDFPGYSGEKSLEPISWDEWFEKFDDAQLALVYQDETARGVRSNFNKLVGRETARARAQGEKTSRRAERAKGRAPTLKRTLRRAPATGARRATAEPGRAAARVGKKTPSRRKAPARKTTSRGKSTARKAPTRKSTRSRR